MTRKIDYAQRFYFSTPYKDLSREVTEVWGYWAAQQKIREIWLT